MTWSSAGLWSFACRWPVVCLRIARGRRLADGPWSSARGWPVVVGRGRLLDPGPAVVVSSVGLPTKMALIRILQLKMSVRVWERWAGARACTNALFLFTLTLTLAVMVVLCCGCMYV